MKKVLLKLICILLPIAGIVAAVNAVVDPAALFLRGRDLSGLAQCLCDGGIAAGYSNMDERKLQRYIIQLQDEVPDMIMVGSSRIMCVDGSQVASGVRPGSYRNHGMSGGGLYDCIAILGAYEAYAESLPKTVIIGADPWLFDGYEPGDRFNDMAVEIDYMEQCMAGKEPEAKSDLRGKLTSAAERLGQLWSIPYFQSSLSYLRVNHGIPEKMYYYVEDENATTGVLRRSDGSMRNSLEEMNKELDVVGAEVHWRVVLKEVNRTSYYPELDRDMQKTFERFVSYLQSQGVEVIFYLVPYHPDFYQLFHEDDIYAGMLAAEEYLLRYAGERSICVYGSYDPAMLGMTEESFLDGVHLRDYELGKVFSLKRD